MQNILSILAGLVATAVAQRTCGAPQPTEQQIAQAKAFYAIEQEARAAVNYSSAAQTIEVNTYFHVLSTSNAVKDGYISVRVQCLLRMNCANIEHRRTLSPCSWRP